MNARESVRRFLLLPSHVAIILLLEFLNSLRSYGLRFVLYNYITNEYGLSDVRAGAMLGAKSLVDIAFGLSGSILVDVFGVRRVSLAALSVALVGRTLLAFGRSQATLRAALYVFSPCGDALLSIGLYRVALKKLSTPTTRPLAFGMSYAVSNMAGACVAVAVDWMRKRAGDVHIDGGGWAGWVGFGGVYTPVRQFIVVTWVILFLTFVLAYCLLEDWTVLDPEDLDEEYRNLARRMKRRGSDLVDDGISAASIAYERPGVDDAGVDDAGVDGNAGDDCGDGRYLSASIPSEVTPVEPMVSPRIWQRWFPVNRHQSTPEHSTRTEECVDDEMHKLKTSDGAASECGPRYMMYRTQFNKAGENEGSPLKGVVHIVKQFLFMMRMRNTWQVLVFSFASVPAAMQWTAGEVVLPPFLERRFGERVPIYTIQSIHMVGCLIFPPFAQAVTSALEDFRVVMPGLWIMALSPLFVAILPSVAGACIWQVFMTAGQVLWSPRQDSWTAGLAPTGMEGLFFAIASSRALLAPMGDLIMGYSNEMYNPNCPECRDQYGHFCGSTIDGDSGGDNLLQCTSIQESCDVFLEGPGQACPTTCLECPTWQPTNPSTFWFLLVATSVTSPLLSWFFLPFLRGRHPREDGCYGLCRASVARFLGICGAPDDGKSCQTYGFIEEEELNESADAKLDGIDAA